MAEAKLDARTAVAALRVLSSELGVAATAGVVAALARARAAGEPFGALDEATTVAEAGSRKQAGDAFLLYRVLTKTEGERRAFELTKAIMLEGGAIYLGMMLQDVIGADPRKRTPEQNEHWLRELLERFPNSTVRDLRVDADSIAFEVSHCRFVELAALTGDEALAKCFCACDDAFFRDVFPNVEFERPQTLAGGADCCKFRFSW